MNNVNDFTQGNITKLILSFYFPMFFTNMLQQVYTVVDTAIVGNGLGDNALAAVGNIGSLNFAIVGFSIGLSVGFTILIAQYFGAKEYDMLKRSIASAIVLSTGIVLLTTLLSNVYLKDALTLLQTDSVILSDSLLYGHVLFYGIFATIAYNLSAAILRAFGDSMTPLKAIIISSIINIILDYALIFIFHTGVGGPAFATIFSQFISAIICIRKIVLIPVAKLEKKHFINPIQIYLKQLRNGIPMAIMNSITAIGCMVVQYFVNGFGVLYTAAYSVCVRYINMFMNPAFTAGNAISAFTSQNYGARKFDRIQRGLYVCIGIAIVTYVLLGLIVMLLFARQLADIFLDSQEAIDLVVQFLHVCGISIIAVDLLFVFRSAVQAMEYPMIPMLSGVAEMVLRIGIIILFASKIGFIATALAESAAWTGALIMNLIAFIYYFQRAKKMRY